MSAPYIIICCNSHRARDKALSISGLGVNALGYYTSYSCGKGKNSKGIHLLTPAEYEKVKDITGVSRPRITSADLGVCWSDTKDETESRKRLNELKEYEKTIEAGLKSDKVSI